MWAWCAAVWCAALCGTVLSLLLFFFRSPYEICSNPLLTVKPQSPLPPNCLQPLDKQPIYFDVTTHGIQNYWAAFKIPRLSAPTVSGPHVSVRHCKNPGHEGLYYISHTSAQWEALLHGWKHGHSSMKEAVSRPRVTAPLLARVLVNWVSSKHA